MENKENRVWGIHTKDDMLFLNGNLIAIGWEEMGDLSPLKDREDIRKKIGECYPDSSKQSIATNTGQVFRFLQEVQVGDYIVFPSKIDRMINIGIVEGNYYYEIGAKDSGFKYLNRRKVKWLKHISRQMFSQGALYEAGSALTIFQIKNYAEEFLSALNSDFKKKAEAVPVEDDTVAATAEEIQENTKDFILKELSRQLKGYSLEGFVANLLQAMGYRTKVSKQGGDSGIDIIAYKDELPPRILVQVKSVDGDIKEATIQSLKGAMREGDYGLFVTLSNYTKNAQAYLDNTPIIRGINGTELVDLILMYYEKLNEKYQRMIPLKKVYIPVVEEKDDIS
ncbi:restriction endonuclease [Butyrivibrio sp. WCD3002]|uniref:restriction endonuclease n=1 Tax=Butyrivibrio sp. WCD3002 TaxID=1280676 RepID=UPI0003F5B9FD|nr:restriction endonuclease [Butyrivibrio sp. WCD3002]